MKKSSFNTQPPEGGWEDAAAVLEVSGVFQHTAARRRLAAALALHGEENMFQHTAARRRLGSLAELRPVGAVFQHTAARRRLACRKRLHASGYTGFNTQPPEGGWLITSSKPLRQPCFNTQPPEGGWTLLVGFASVSFAFQHTAARRRLAADDTEKADDDKFQHTAARRRLGTGLRVYRGLWKFQHTAARRRLEDLRIIPILNWMFQHTAARRRLGCADTETVGVDNVSTHSRPKAAGNSLINTKIFNQVSTHSRPKAAGWRD